MDVSSYEGVESRSITIKKDLDQDVKGKDILLVEDILDTGKTLSTVKAMLEERGAASVEIVTMLDKKEGRTSQLKQNMQDLKFLMHLSLVLDWILMRNIETYLM